MATLAVMAVGCVLVQAQVYPIPGDYDDWYGPPTNGWHLPGECNNWNAECRFKNLNDNDCDDCERACNGEQICELGDCQPNPEWCGDIERTDCERRRDRCEDLCGEDKCIGMHDTLCADIYDDCVQLYNEEMLKIVPNYQYCVDQVIAQDDPGAWLKEECCNEIASQWVNTACVKVHLPNTCREACYPPKFSCDDPECYYCLDPTDVECAYPFPECDAECEACSAQCNYLFPLSSGRAAPMNIEHATDEAKTAAAVALAPTTYGALTAVGGVIAVLLACIAGLLCFAICARPLLENMHIQKDQCAVNIL